MEKSIGKAAVSLGNAEIKYTGLVKVAQDEAKVKSKPQLTLKQQRERDREPVRGVFKYHENPGGIVKFSIKLYREDPIETYELRDGASYTLPRGVAMHLNKNTSYPEYEHSRVAVEASGIPELKVKRKVSRMGFYPLDFIDVGEDQSQILTVER